MGAGRGDEGQLGGGRRQDSRTPQAIMAGVRSAAGGRAFTLIVGENRSVWAAGSTRYGQIPGNPRQDRLVPEQLLPAPAGNTR
jgi:alpha-tubulin suppressor-like RCC1 family protein